MSALRNFAINKANMDGWTFKNMDEQCELIFNKRRDNEVPEKWWHTEWYCQECKAIKEENKMQSSYLKPLFTTCCVRIFGMYP